MPQVSPNCASRTCVRNCAAPRTMQSWPRMFPYRVVLECTAWKRPPSAFPVSGNPSSQIWGCLQAGWVSRVPSKPQGCCSFSHKHVLPININFAPLLLHSWLTQVAFQWTGTWRSSQVVLRAWVVTEAADEVIWWVRAAAILGHHWDYISQQPAVWSLVY